MKKQIALLALIGSLTCSTMADDDWFLRFGAVNVSPNSDSGPVLGNDGVQVGGNTQFGLSLIHI